MSVNVHIFLISRTFDLKMLFWNLFWFRSVVYTLLCKTFVNQLSLFIALLLHERYVEQILFGTFFPVYFRLSNRLLGIFDSTPFRAWRNIHSKAFSMPLPAAKLVLNCIIGDLCDAYADRIHVKSVCSLIDVHFSKSIDVSVEMMSQHSPFIHDAQCSRDSIIISRWQLKVRQHSYWYCTEGTMPHSL